MQTILAPVYLMISLNLVKDSICSLYIRCCICDLKDLLLVLSVTPIYDSYCASNCFSPQLGSINSRRYHFIQDVIEYVRRQIG